MVEKRIQESPISTHTSLSVSEDLGPSRVTNRRTAPVMFTVDCRRGHALSTQAAVRSVRVEDSGPTLDSMSDAPLLPSRVQI